MTDTSKLSDYELNEEDINKTLNFLRIFDPEHATPEHAIAFLEYLRVGFHEKAHDARDEDLEALYREFTKQQPNE